MARAKFITRSNSHVRESDLEAQREVDEDEEEDEQRQPLLTTTPSPSTSQSRLINTTRRSSRIGSLYGTNNNSMPHFIHLEDSSDDTTTVRGRSPTVARSESLLKVAGLIDDREGEFECFRMPEEKMRGMKSKVKDFYRRQNGILDSFLEVDEILLNARAVGPETGPIIPAGPGGEKKEALANQVKLAINVNIVVNIILLVAKIAVVLLSNSMSLIASTVDSGMDFLSTLIIWATSRVMERSNWRETYNYPTGKRRMEPMSVLIFSVVMISSFVQVFIESLHRLLDPDLQIAQIPPSGIAAMVATILIKSLIWIWCRTIKNTSVEALTLDAENDIVFNFFSLLFPIIGQYLGWKYLDPLGGALLSVYIIVGWSQTLFENAQKLTGKRASPGEHQRVAYLLTRFSNVIRGVQHLSVYASGDHSIIEVDIVVHPSTGLTMAHNVAESAQYGLEQLEGVERAFVHVDVSVNPLSGHLR